MLCRESAQSQSYNSWVSSPFCLWYNRRSSRAKILLIRVLLVEIFYSVIPTRGRAMDLFQLEVFVTVAREGSFSRAAEKLYRTQPAVSQAIRKLEREIGESLFDRSSRDGTLTDAGQMLHEYAQKLLNLRSEARVALRELREMHKGKLAIAANEFTCLYLLPALAEFRRLYPMIKVTVLRSLASRIPADVIKHSAELGVLSFNPEEPLLRSIVVYR